MSERKPVPIPPMVSVGEGGEPQPVNASLSKMAEIALGRLGSPDTVLKMLYVDNEFVPNELRDLFIEFLEGKVTKEEASEQLRKLATV